MHNDYNKADYKSIEMIVAGIADKKIYLPEFQRPFVWSLEQSVDLFDSLARGIFIGPLIIAQPRFDLYCKEFDNNPRRGKGSRAPIREENFLKNDFEMNDIFVLLDGQQRATSIYRALKGSDKLYFVLKKPFDLPAPNAEIKSLEQIIEGFSSTKLNSNICIEISDIYKCYKEDWREKRIEQEILEVAISEALDYDGIPALKDKYFDILLSLKKLFIMLITDKTLLSVFLLDMDLEKFCLFFERSNSKGISLNFIDIISAKVYVGFKLKKETSHFINTYKRKLSEPEVECFVRYICYLKKGFVDKKTILTYVDHNDFNSHWDEICSLFIKSTNFIISENILPDISWLTYNTMIIPIIHFLSCLPSKDFSQRTQQQDKLFKFWFWGSLLINRYGGGIAGSTNDVIVEDCKMLENLAKFETLNKDTIKKFRFSFDFEDLLDITSKGAKFNCIMALINNKLKLEDWVNAGSINFKEKVDAHHVFPVKYIENSFAVDTIERDYVDSILNKVTIGKITNIKFSDNSPSVYLGKIKNKNSDIVNSMGTHLIPKPQELIDGGYDSNFIDFLHDRYELIYSLLKKEILDLKEEILSN